MSTHIVFVGVSSLLHVLNSYFEYSPPWHVAIISDSVIQCSVQSHGRKSDQVSSPSLVCLSVSAGL